MPLCAGTVTKIYQINNLERFALKYLVQFLWHDTVCVFLKVTKRIKTPNAINRPIQRIQIESQPNNYVIILYHLSLRTEK